MTSQQVAACGGVLCPTSKRTSCARYVSTLPARVERMCVDRKTDAFIPLGQQYRIREVA
jgi:hypothetical protein